MFGHFIIINGKYIIWTIVAYGSLLLSRLHNRFQSSSLGIN